MKLTIEQYVTQCFALRKNKESDLVNINAEVLEHYIRIMQGEVAYRMKFDLPVYFINSYNIALFHLVRIKITTILLI